MRFASLLPLLRGLVVGLVVAAALASAAPAFAVTPDEILPDPQLEARARALSHELRCMVCQNQSIDDSDAPLAHDLRVLVRDRLKAGDSDPQVIDFLVARYGEFVLLKPRFEWHTVPLWLAPIALLLIGGIAVFVAARRKRSATGTPAPAPLSKSEQARLAELTKPGRG
jgi:cytochrome c-type biogenesis protein CcmH